MTDCVFCNIIAGYAPATIIHEWDDAIAIVPLNPVVEGHLLVIPRRHVTDFTQIPGIFGIAAMRAALAAHLAGGDYNLITSKGPAATQTVFHLHIHLVPRREGDGLMLPWSEPESLAGA